MIRFPLDRLDEPMSAGAEEVVFPQDAQKWTCLRQGFGRQADAS